MHTAIYEFLMKLKESAECHQTLSARVGSGDETMVGQADTQKGTSPHMMQIRVQEVDRTTI